MIRVIEQTRQQNILLLYAFTYFLNYARSVSPAKRTQCVTRKRHGDTSNSFNFATGEMDWDNALKGTYSAGTIAGMLGAGVMAGMNVKFSGMDAATNKFYGGEGAKTEKRDDGKRVVRLNGYRDDMTEAEQLAMGATLQWEAHRDGEVTADNYLETRQAFKSSTEMAQRMLAAGLDVDTSGVIGINLAAYEYAKSQGDMSMLDMFVDTFYRSDGDYQGIDFDKLTQELFTPGSDLQQKLRDLTQEGFKEFAGTSLPGNLGELDLSRLKEIQEQGKSAFEAASSYLPDRDVYVLADNAFKEMFQRFQRGESAPEPTTPPATDVAKQMLEGASAEFSYDFNKFSGGGGCLRSQRRLRQLRTARHFVGVSDRRTERKRKFQFVLQHPRRCIGKFLCRHRVPVGVREFSKYI
ncbi:MAG: hypothetical protein Ta2A_10670 [Treponemataceae bacterium]|nr:MAG: hypothetical protein Ta2A_10670 [Treponemataceae bacterium]